MIFKTVVWATDGSESADLALPYIRQLAEDDAKLVVAHCEEFVVGPRAGGYTVHADEDELKAKIERQVKELAEQGHEVAYRLLGSAAGGAAHRIADVAREEGGPDHADVAREEGGPDRRRHPGAHRARSTPASASAASRRSGTSRTPGHRSLSP
jgi:hypothetical protein